MLSHASYDVAFAAAHIAGSSATAARAAEVVARDR